MGLHKDVNITAVIQTTQPYKFLVDYKQVKMKKLSLAQKNSDHGQVEF